MKNGQNKKFLIFYFTPTLLKKSLIFLIMEQYNNKVLQENNILSKYNNHLIYILLDATHMIWLNDNYKNTIIQTITLMTKN